MTKPRLGTKTSPRPSAGGQPESSQSLIRILHLEDDPSDAELIRAALEADGLNAQIEHVATRAPFIALLQAVPYDLILADYNLPDLDGATALALARERSPDTPFIVISGHLGDDEAVEILKSGATDYVLKDRLTRLPSSLRRALREVAERAERRRAEEASREMAERLSLTLKAVRMGTWQWNIPEEEIVWDEQMHVLFGLESGTFRGDPTAFGECLHPDDRERAAEEFARTLTEDREYDTQYRVVRPDGMARTIRSRGQVNRDAEGRPRRMIGVCWDATERQESERQIRRQIERLRALRRIDTAITATTDLRVALETILDEVTRQLGVDAADILLLNRGSNTLEFGAARGFRTDALQHTRLFLGQGFAGRAALERRIVTTLDFDDTAARAEFSRSPRLEEEGFVVYFGVPLEAKGSVNGVLEIFHRTRFKPDPEWMEFLEALAGQASIAVEDARLFRHMQRSHAELHVAYEATLEGWVRALDMRDHETEGHTQRVTELTVRLAQALEFDEEELVHIRRGALLHDIGKLAIPDGILRKPGPLTDEEWAIMKQHPTHAFQWLSPIKYLRPAVDIPYCHHERWNGSGYPRGLKGEEIPLAARIFALVDVWDALTSDRPYRPAWPREQAFEHMVSRVGTDFDPQVAEIFLRLIEPPSPRPSEESQEAPDG